MLSPGHGAGGRKERDYGRRHQARRGTPVPGSSWRGGRFGRCGMSQTSWTIAVLPGDGIGPEVIRAAASILQDCAGEFGFRVNLGEFPFGGIAIDKCAKPLPHETLVGCLNAVAV